MLKDLGIKHVCTVQKMPLKLMQAALGENGKSIWKKCQGIDNSPVIPYQERKSIGLERTFERDTTDIVKLKSILIAMAENLAFQLRNGNKLTSCVTVVIRYADLSFHTRQMRVSYTSMDDVLIEAAKSLFSKLYDRRLLIRLVGIRYSHLVEGGYQMNLLEDSEEYCKLHQAMDFLRRRHGQNAVKRAVAMGSRGIGRINPFNGEPPVIPAHRRA
jgi:DNA polymerase-4